MPRLDMFNKTYQMLGRSMDISAKRHSLISGNIANIDTVGYKPKDIDFQKALKKAMDGSPGPLSRTDRKHLPAEVDPLRMSIETGTDATDRYHLEAVDIDKEMSKLVQNNIKYRTSVEMLLRKVGILRQTITEGGK